MSRIVALIAAKDSEGTVGATVEALAGIPEVDEVMVVDDGSTDATCRAALAAGARVLRLPRNLGKGGAIAEGVAATPHADVYLLVDADLGATARSTRSLLAPVLEGRADLTIGVLPSAGSKGGFGLIRRAAAGGIRLVSGFTPQAPLSGQRAVRGDLLRSLHLASRFGLETGFTIDAVKAGARVLEVPIEADHRHTGRRLAGFVHRGGQGLDIARALWERVTTSRGRTALIAGALILALTAMAWSGSRWEPSSVPAAPGADKVLIFSMPGLGWGSIGTGTMPNLDKLIDTGSLAAMTVRSGSSRPDIAEAYATLGAGSKVDFEGEIPASIRGKDGGPLNVDGAMELRRLSAGHQPTLPGELGEALHAAGRRTAVVSGAGPWIVPSGPLGSRIPPAALGLMDRSGAVDRAVVDYGSLVEPDPAAPLGVKANPERLSRAALAALGYADVVLVDPGDMTRVEVLQKVLGPEVSAEAQRSRALANADDILGRIVSRAPVSTMVLVVSVVPPDVSWRLTPVVAAGAGVIPGQLHSPSTKHNGLVTLTDLAPTILSAVGAPVPPAMPGQTLRYSARPATAAPLVKLDRDAAYRESIYLRVAVAFVLAQALVYAAALGVLARKRRRAGRVQSARGARTLRAAVVASAAFPLSTFLFRAIPFAPRLGFAGVAGLAAIDALIVAAALRARRHPLAPLAWVMGATVAVLVLDVATGGRLQSASILGYSPYTAARFYGLGNSAFAVLAGTTILFAAIHLERAPRRREALATVACLFALVLFLHGAPTLGNDVGGILTLTPVFAVTLVALSGRRISWKVLAAGAGIMLVVLCGAAAVDLIRPPAARTHLGRFAADLLAGRGGTFWTTIARKAETNLRVLGATVWTWVVPIVGAFVLGMLGWRLKLKELLPAGSPRRIGVYAAVGAGLLGFVVNDSGIVITALVLVFVAPYLTLLALANGSLSGRPVLLEPGSPDSPGFMA